MGNCPIWQDFGQVYRFGRHGLWWKLITTSGCFHYRFSSIFSSHANKRWKWEWCGTEKVYKSYLGDGLLCKFQQLLQQLGLKNWITSRGEIISPDHVLQSMSLPHKLCSRPVHTSQSLIWLSTLLHMWEKSNPCTSHTLSLRLSLHASCLHSTH